MKAQLQPNRVRACEPALDQDMRMAVPRKEQPLPKIAGPHLVSLLKSSLQRSPIQTDYHMVCFRNKTGLIARLGGEVHGPVTLISFCFFGSVREHQSVFEAFWQLFLLSSISMALLFGILTSIHLKAIWTTVSEVL